MDIENMDYSTFVSYINERNRCSGGIKAIQEVIVNARLNELSRVLEVGSNTGFTSVNLAYLSGSKITGVDINKQSIQFACEYATRNGLDNLVNFVYGNAENLPFKNETFDLVWASNVTSFISNKQKAVEEYLRVLKLGGTLVVIPIYYVIKPPNSLIDSVSAVIGEKISVRTKEDWKNLIESNVKTPLELYHERDFRYFDVNSQIDNFVEIQVSKPHLNLLTTDEKDILRKKARSIYHLFNRNLKHCGFSILLYQKRREKDEKELYISRPVRQ